MQPPRGASVTVLSTGVGLTELGFAPDVQQVLADAFEASPNAYVLLTPDLTIAAANRAYAAATRSRARDLIGKPIFGHFTSGDGEDAPENVRQVRESMRRAIQSRTKDHLAMVRFSIAEPQPDGGEAFVERLWSATHTPILGADGEVVWLLQHTTDVTELQRARGQDLDAVGDPITALDAIVGGGVFSRARLVQEDFNRLEVERNRLIEMFMQAPGFIAVLSGPDHEFQLFNEAYASLVGRNDIGGKSVAEALPEVAEQGFVELLGSVYETGEPYEGRAQRIWLQRTPDAAPQEMFLDFIYQPIRGADGRSVGIFVQGHDVTETVKAAERQKLMIDELNHRVKNTLATVQSIAMQTARSHPEPQTFARSFQSRLLSLSHTHDLLTRSHWEGADLRAILEHETEAHGVTRLVPNGPPVALDPPAALSLGMIFHELATNAAKYGALSSPEGRVFVDWSVSNQADRVLHLNWRETGGPEVTPPERRGFGGRLIERNVRHDLAGDVRVSYPPEGLVFEMTAPLDKGRE
jgi:two-component sensor histidine kinase